MKRTQRHCIRIAGGVAIASAPLLALALDVGASQSTHLPDQTQAGTFLSQRIEQLRQAARQDASLYPESSSGLRISQFYNWCNTCK